VLIVTIRRDEFPIASHSHLPPVLQPGVRFSYGDNNVEAVVISIIDRNVTLMLAGEPVFMTPVSDREIASSKILEQYGTSVAPEEIVDISEQNEHYRLDRYQLVHSRNYYLTWRVTTIDETFVVSF